MTVLPVQRFVTWTSAACLAGLVQGGSWGAAQDDIACVLNHDTEQMLLALQRDANQTDAASLEGLLEQLSEGRGGDGALEHARQALAQASSGPPEAQARARQIAGAALLLAASQQRLAQARAIHAQLLSQRQALRDEKRRLIESRAAVQDLPSATGEDTHSSDTGERE